MAVWGDFIHASGGDKRRYPPRPAGHFGSLQSALRRKENVSRARGEYRAGSSTVRAQANEREVQGDSFLGASPSGAESRPVIGLPESSVS